MNGEKRIWLFYNGETLGILCAIIKSVNYQLTIRYFNKFLTKNIWVVLFNYFLTKNIWKCHFSSFYP